MATTNSNTMSAKWGATTGSGGGDIVVDVRSLTIGYGKTVVLENISFDIRRGEIFVILGGSGCGKSTLLKHIIGLHPPFKGDILINGMSMVSSSGEERRQIMRRFGVLYQSGALFGSLTLAENIALPMEELTNFPRKRIAEIIKDKLALVGLDGFQEYMPAELSGGMKKRAGLARAMALDPELLFFDEPSAGLDPISSADLDKLILDLRARLRTSMVIVTHELDSIFAIADRVVILDKETRGIIASGNPRELREHPPNQWVDDFLNRKGTKR